jgi:hypothetical protein
MRIGGKAEPISDRVLADIALLRNGTHATTRGDAMPRLAKPATKMPAEYLPPFGGN